ncbi:MAG: NHL repeat-containing protein [Actinomycetota bacterium]|jgi:DNA-binding beta-propeller fold protein YncE|nr:NHL repeat-containing protein [Actinomycetota bacterium]
MSPRFTRIILSAVIVLLLGLLVIVGGLLLDLQEEPLLTPRPRDASFEWQRSIYGYGPSEEEQLLMPTSVAISPEGDIYVTDPIRSRVLVFDSAGDFIRAVDSLADDGSTALFVRPEAIDVDADNGDLYIADSRTSRIVVFSDRGEYVRDWTVPGQARGLKVTDEQVLVLGLGRVTTYDKLGNELSGFGTRGSRPGQIDAYLGIESDGDRIYIADSFNKRIQAFSMDGELIWTYPGSVADSSSASVEATGNTEAEEAATDEDHEYQLPQDLVLDGAGRLVVVDAFRFELVVINAEDGQVVNSYGEYGRYDGELYFPTSIDYDFERDWFVVADTQNNRVQIVRLPGSAGSVLAPLRRLTKSPSRYVVPSLVLFAAAFVAAFVGLLRVLRKRRAN